MASIPKETETGVQVTADSAISSPEGPVGKDYGDQVGLAERGALKDPKHVALRRDLSARHISMLGMIFPS